MRTPRPPRRAVAAAAAAAMLTLAGCVGADPLDLPDDHPASPRAEPGFVDAPSVLAGYRSADDFAAVAGEASPSSLDAGRSHHAGMRHGSMPETAHGAAIR